MTADGEENAKTVILTDGRRLCYVEFGSPDGQPVFYFHGCPGSRLEAELLKEKLTPFDARLIAIDRPGMGLSDYQKDRSILDCAGDVLELADYLKIEQFKVLGGSGGGPYALACAYRIPSERLTGCAIAAGLGPYDLDKTGMNKRSKNLLVVARHFPWSFRFLLWLSMGRKAEDRDWWEKNYQKLSENLPGPDKKISLEPSVRDVVIAKTMDAFRQGSRGPAQDYKLYAKPWGFKLGEIPAETRVLMYHGEQDVSVPVTMARTMSEQIPNCKIKIYPDEGHLSVFLNKFDVIMTSLLEK